MVRPSTVWTETNDIDALRNTRRDNRPPRMQLSRYELQAYDWSIVRQR